MDGGVKNQPDSMHQLHATLTELEQLRKRYFKKGLTQGLIVAGVCFVGALALFFTEPVMSVYAMFVALVGLVLLPVCIGGRSKEFSMLYKQRVISPIVTSLCGNAQYVPHGGITADEFRWSGLFIRPDRYHAEDLIEGQIGQTPFCFSEVHAEERRTSSNGKRTQTYYVDIFRGFMFVADFHKNFSGYTRVERSSMLKLRFGSDLSRVKLENSDFERRFDVYSTDGVEARYLLTPSLMERIIALDNCFGGIQVAFRDSCVVIAIPDSTDHFEAGVWRSILKNSTVDFEIATLRNLFSIVDNLNLNTRIWTKE